MMAVTELVGFFTVLLYLIVAAALKHVVIQETDTFSRHLPAVRWVKKLLMVKCLYSYDTGVINDASILATFNMYGIKVHLIE